jgi:hypothetical protein
MSGHLNSQVLFGTHPVCFTEGGDHYASKSCIHATKARLLITGRQVADAPNSHFHKVSSHHKRLSFLFI